MSVTQQVRVNGGAPDTGSVAAVVGDTIQPTVASMATWGSPVARWEIYDFPDGFALPAGWTEDVTSEVYYYLGNSDPPAFDVDPWGAYELVVYATVGGTRVSDRVEVLVESDAGLKDLGRGEGALYGGLKKRWVAKIQENLRVLEAGLGAAAAATALAVANTIMARDGNADTAVRKITAQEVLAAATELILRSASGTSVAIYTLASKAFDFNVTTNLSQILAGGSAGLKVEASTGGDASLCANTGNEVNLTVNAVDILSAGGAVVTCHVASLAFPTNASVIAPTVSGSTGKSLTVRGGAPASGSAGGALNIEGGAGNNGAAGPVNIGTDGNPAGTNAAGGVVVQMGTTVAGVCPGVSYRCGATQKLLIDSTATTPRMRAGTGLGGSGSGGAADFNIEASSVGISGFSTVALVAATITLQGNFITIPGGTYISTPSTPAFSATPTFNLGIGNHHIPGVATADMTLIDASNIRAGTYWSLDIIQDGTGTWTPTFAAKFLASAEHTLAADETANHRTHYDFFNPTTTLILLVGKTTFTS